MDRPDNAPADLRRALRDLRAVNRLLGGRAALWRGLRPFLERLPADRGIEILDVGTGDADLPRFLVDRARRLGRRLTITGVDRDPATVAIARREAAAYPEIRIVQADALRLPFPPAAFDLVTASLLTHHLTEEQVVGLLRSLRATARLAVVINDLQRHWIPWGFIHLASRAARLHPMVVHDAPLSVLRGFTPPELRALAARAGVAGASIRGSWAYRLVLTLPGEAGA